MQGTLKLKNPIALDGGKLTEVTYDTNEITAIMFLDADRRASPRELDVKVMEVNTGFHFYLGCQAIIALNCRIDISDLERTKGSDVLAITKVGRLFFGQSEDSEEESSAAPSETTPEPSALPSES
ncbi:MAG: hypothetical protein FWE76_08435 [Symbiobacteriaceae bacterium]|nr:hypothetical protein [Symbiobacteriaceae bacterium]